MYSPRQIAVTIDGADIQEPSGNFDKINEIIQTSTQINNVSNNFTLDNLFIFRTCLYR